MPRPTNTFDPDGLLEYSVVFTDRALNHMSARFQEVMRDLSSMLKEVYGAHAALVMPGSGTFGMEAVARQFAGGSGALIIRNGLFSYRWSQIIEAGQLYPPGRVTVLTAAPAGAVDSEGNSQGQWAPPPAHEVAAAIREERPAAVFAAHVETASGILLPDAYLREVAAATHEVGGLFVLDCVASGAVWVDMREIGIDVLLSAPQKGWSSPAGAAIVCLSNRAAERLRSGSSTSFALDLSRWLDVMRSYEEGGHTYYATLPTTTLLALRDAMRETVAGGLESLKSEQFRLGRNVRQLLAERGFPSVAAPGFEAPGVVVSHTTDEGVRSGRSFAKVGVQVAAGVPLMCGEPESFSTFRVGLFGLDKLADVEGTVKRLADALTEMGYPAP